LVFGTALDLAAWTFLGGLALPARDLPDPSNDSRCDRYPDGLDNPLCVSRSDNSIDRNNLSLRLDINYTGSVFIVILFHALTNLITFLPPALVVGQQRLVIIIGFMPGLLVLVLQLLLGKERFPDQGITNQ